MQVSNKSVRKNSPFDCTKRSSLSESESGSPSEESLILPSKLMRSPPITALTFALGIVMTPAAAQSPAEFYKGKTITIMLGIRPAARTMCTHGLRPITCGCGQALRGSRADAG